MGSVPLQVGTGVKQEQIQPWAKSQQNGDGWQEQGQPWEECQFVGTEDKQGQGNRGISALQKGNGQQQGNRGISALQKGDGR